jgi:ligand-binding SRPBCC domain-containing protein
MQNSRESAIAGVVAGRVELGDTVTFRARHFGIWFIMTTQIVEMTKPMHFSDEQTRGPFRSFRHEHRFASAPEGGTRMVDIIDLGSPILGKLVERLILVPYLRRIIRQRNAHLAASFGHDN